MVLLLQQGDSAAFDQLFEKYKNMAVRSAYLITGNPAVCEDIVQETFIQCFKNIGKLRNPQGFKAWFYRILTRTAWRYGKAAAQEIAVENIVAEVDQASLDTSVDEFLRSETDKMLFAEIDGLPPKLKTVIILYYFSGLSVKEIAKAVGCLEGTVKSRLHTARRSLKKSMEAEDLWRKELDQNAEYKFI